MDGVNRDEQMNHEWPFSIGNDEKLSHPDGGPALVTSQAIHLELIQDMVIHVNSCTWP